MGEPRDGERTVPDDPREEAVRQGERRTGSERPVRKNHYLYQSKIDMVKEILNAKTETEALDTALDLLIYGEALAEGTEAMDGEEYRDVLGVAREVPEPGQGG